MGVNFLFIWGIVGIREREREGGGVRVDRGLIMR